MKTFHNPILSGFYPDPSICKVQDTYYLVTSSFVYFPGLPIFESKDLVHWTQIGHAIHRPEQLDYKNCETSLGLWAPTIRYHNGTFFIINTFVSGGREVNRDNFIITAKHPAGPWSDPIFIQDADGIDPSLFFDDDGSLWYTGNYISSTPLYEGHHGIYLQELDPNTFQFIGNRYQIWDGNITHSKWIEAPHLYKYHNMYYLLVAEGGTFTNHSIMMARCNTIHGTYEICPRNPIVSHRHMPLTNTISVVGHADIIETQNHEWWMVLLGIRPDTSFHYNLGRETFLLPVKWDSSDGWLRVDNENGIVNSTERFPSLPESAPLLSSSTDHFEEDHLSFIWNMIHPVPDCYQLQKRIGFLRLLCRPDVLHEISSPAFIGRRQQHKCFQAETVMEFTPHSVDAAGLVLIQDDRYNYQFLISSSKEKKEDTYAISVYQTENGSISLLYETNILNPQKRFYLAVRGTENSYQFYYGKKEHSFLPIGPSLDATLLSSTTNEGFTGTYIGMYATANHTASTNHADFNWFSYTH